MRADRLRLLDAIEQVELIADFPDVAGKLFGTTLMVQSAILHCLALLGEACRGVSGQLPDAHPEIPWKQIIAFRYVGHSRILRSRSRYRDIELVWTIAARTFQSWVFNSNPSRRRWRASRCSGVRMPAFANSKSPWLRTKASCPRGGNCIDNHPAPHPSQTPLN